MSRVTRRRFVKQSLGIASTFAISGTKSSGNIIGSNEAIHLAVAGINSRGKSHIDHFGSMPDVRVTYLVDPDTRLFKSRSKMVTDRGGNTPKTVQDFRRVLDDKSVDALSIATCNHWHAPMTIFACEAGKDVYVEKPCSHNVHEGRIAVETARKHGRIVQHGTQNRADDCWRAVQDIARSGKLGKLLVSHGISSKGRGTIDFKEPKQPPAEVDFNLWLGPAPKQPYHENLVHYNWHWFWDFGNGEIGNQGVHQMDVARWGIPDATLPTSVLSIGGRFGYRDQAQTPNTQLTIFEFGETLLVFEVCGLVEGKQRYTDNDFYFEEGKIIGGKTFYPKGSKEPQKLAELDVTNRPERAHFRNFIDTMRTRRVEELYADILEAHYSAALCHLGNISYRLGSDVPFGGSNKPFGQHTYANESWERLEEHLAKSRGLQLGDMSYRVGRQLDFDPQKEQFVSDADSNRMLTRKYRKEFAIPEKVV